MAKCDQSNNYNANILEAILKKKSLKRILSCPIIEKSQTEQIEDGKINEANFFPPLPLLVFNLLNMYVGSFIPSGSF